MAVGEVVWAADWIVKWSPLSLHSNWNKKKRE